jgi:peptidoglycan/LPS O-acetylase OafA/YrhL
MLIYFSICFIARYFVKDEKKFLLIIACVCLVATILHSTSFFYSWGVVRACMGISLGILISYIPNLKIKKKGLIWLALVPVQILVLLILVFGNNLLMEKVLDLILYPALIYLSFQLNISNKVLNYLGSLSFGLYAFQCVVRPFELLGLSNLWVMFLIVVVLAVMEDGLKRYLRYRKRKMQSLQRCSI